MNPFRKLMASLNVVADAFFRLAKSVNGITEQIDSRLEGLDGEEDVIDVDSPTNSKRRKKRISGRR